MLFLLTLPFRMLFGLLFGLLLLPFVLALRSRSCCCGSSSRSVVLLVALPFVLLAIGGALLVALGRRPVAR